MNKTILVKAYFSEINSTPRQSMLKSDPWGNPNAPTNEPKNADSEVKANKCIVDSERLQRDLDLAIALLNESGYEVQSVVPIISGAYNYQYQDQEISSYARPFTKTEAISDGVSYGYGYGYSYTDSLIVIARKQS
ncbi:hypothetical protein H5202_20255 [Shewanella sp. SG41-4]|uniref:hypothetical protein n=1 Tax=Shewanella sp. SG41-4 TaxID=2760976 RepID=UPI0016003CE3|nr:hypothetical protein [Shewanella sp. SG41-4]MBB1440944.1 hypothetical protein [Shewanella sp. SG41-4]